ncbi:PREDICTED: uncharacterized protein LOC108563426 [Nicrophorus vespilloides]|uniref:Uncharacterized protein LOC108563426 n=1 Tax=Nicrophorus vespilloides TaxID=110193 RepID=A0ABM1MSN4_NICVS|nr:PREDICTED: uncharacterized protein LOC108563426 [Nicrophorus vespilloides]
MMDNLLKWVYFFLLFSSIPHVLSSYYEAKFISKAKLKQELAKIQDAVDIDLSEHIDIVDNNMKYFEIRVDDEYEYAMYTIDRSLDEALKKIRQIVEIAMNLGTSVTECIEDIEEYFSELEDISSTEVRQCFKTVPVITKTLCDNQFWEVRIEIEDTLQDIKKGIDKCILMCQDKMLTKMNEKKEYLLDAISKKTEDVLGSISDFDAVNELCPLDEYLEKIDMKIADVYKCLGSP